MTAELRTLDRIISLGEYCVCFVQQNPLRMEPVVTEVQSYEQVSDI